MLLYDDSFDSSAIAAIAYDCDAQALFVFFKEGARVWRYDGATRSVYEAFWMADSKGKHFQDHIRNQFPTTQLSEAEISDLRQRRGGDLQISWVEQLAGTPVAQDTLGLFF